MAEQERQQGLPLAASGVPDTMQAQAASSAPDMPNLTPPQRAPIPAVAPEVQVNPQPIDRVLALLGGQSHAQQLQQMAEAQYPTQTPASILSALSGIAGNIAGAVTRRGAVGEGAVDYGQRLLDQQRQKQNLYAERLKESEAEYIKDQANLVSVQNAQLRANSLYGRINSEIADPKVRADMFARLATGDPREADKVDQDLKWTQEFKRKTELDDLNNELKRQRAENAQTQLVLAREREDRTKTEHDRAFDMATRKEQESIFQKQSGSYTKEIAPYQSAITALTSLERSLGGVDSDAARGELGKITGLKGIGASTMGDAKTKDMIAKMNTLFGVMKKPEFGGRMSREQQGIINTAYNFTLGGGALSNVTKSPEDLQNALVAIRNELQNRVGTAANKLSSGVRARMELGEDGAGPSVMTSKRMADIAAQARRVGPVDLQKPPAGISQSTWLKANDDERMQMHENLQNQLHLR